MEDEKTKYKCRTSLKKHLLLSIFTGGIIAFVISAGISFSFLFPGFKKKEVQMSENTTESLLQLLENTFSLVEDYMGNAAATVEQNYDVQMYLRYPDTKNKTKASVRLNNLASYMGMIRGIALVGENAPVIDSMTNIVQEDLAVVESDNFEEMRKNGFGRLYSPVYYATVGSNTYCTVAYARNYYLDSQWCTIIMFVNLNTTLQNMKSLAKNSLDGWYLVDSTGNGFYEIGEKADIKDTKTALTEKDESLKRCSLSGDIIFQDKSAMCGYEIVSIVKKESILMVLFPYIAGFLGMLFIFLILVLFMNYRNVNTLINPVLVLSKHMLMAAKGDLNCKVDIDREDEIGQLESSFNKMIDDLRHSIEIIGEKEAKEQQIRFSLLVSQIDPHFIYNTINSINYLARKKRCEDIVTVNSALIAILKDRLRVNDIQITDTIANEIRVVNQYIEIEKFMYDGELEVEWNIDPEFMEEQIPKNMIQPLVENALFHGLIDEESGEFCGKIRITVYKTENQQIVLCVEDNGGGMEKQRLDEIRSLKFNPEDRGRKIGLSNIFGRLYYLYGNADCMKIESELSKGTKITIVFGKK